MKYLLIGAVLCEIEHDEAMYEEIAHGNNKESRAKRQSDLLIRFLQSCNPKEARDKEALGGQSNLRQ